ncbi:phenylalanine-tRNA ligase, beta subunit [Sesbania bispinosa]|nr:phenylalanine-tRNA ligase, beta subunit [Sesbania bispinosa]
MDRWFVQVHYPIPGKEYKHGLEYLPEEVIPGYKVQHADDFHYVDKKMTD